MKRCARVACSREFDVEHGKGWRRTWCSLKCCRIYNSEMGRVQWMNIRAKGQRYATHEQRMYILSRDGYRCFYCGVAVTNDTANMEHVTPWPKGKTTTKNLVTACHDCNRSKGRREGLRLRRKEGRPYVKGDVEVVIPRLGRQVNA